MRHLFLCLFFCIFALETKAEIKPLKQKADSPSFISSKQAKQNHLKSSLNDQKEIAKDQADHQQAQTQPTLQAHYQISREKIFSTDLFPQAPYFFIASFGEAFDLRLKAKQLEVFFQSQGFPLQSSTFDEIKFSYQSPWNLLQIQNQIKEAFLSYYAPYQPQVSKVHLKPIGQISSPSPSFSLPQIDERLLKKNRFLVMLEVSNHSTSSFQPFLCEIEASLEVFTALKEIRAGEDLTHLKKERIAFSSFSTLPAQKEEILSSSAKSFIAQGQIIFSSKLKPKILVKRGDLVDVSLREGKISLEGRLEALQNGVMGDEILARNPESKKQIKIKITGVRKGRIL